MTRILAIETSCDETAAAVIEDGRHILSNVVATQIELHRRFGGIFPEVASRQHVLSIHPVIRQALQEANIAHVREVDAVAVTHGPGLAGSLLVGVNAAKGLAFGAGLPLLPVNHLEGHVYSNWLDVDRTEPAPAKHFPLLVLIVSGGHTELVLMTGHCAYRWLGGTLDDAAGEAFDKVARLLGLSFPGGPAIQQAAQAGNPERYQLPRPLMQHDGHRYNFSFSGLKTAALNLVRQLEKSDDDIHNPQIAADVAASFQAAVVDVLVEKTATAAKDFGVQNVCICGGVSANAQLRSQAYTRLNSMGLPLTIPPLFLCTDNAAMVGSAAHFRWQTDPYSPADLNLDVFANLPLAEAET